MGTNEASRYIPARRGIEAITSFSKSQRALLLFGLVALLVMTGCSSKRTEEPPQKPQVTIDSSSVTQDLPQMDSTPTLSPSTAPILKTPPKRAVSPQNLPKTTPKPTTSPSPKAVLFGAPIPWESTPPEKLATPWTSIPPAATTKTIAIVQLDPHSILVATERGLTRSAVVVKGVNGFRIEKNVRSGFADAVLVTCPDGSEDVLGIFAAQRTWNATQHPSTYTLFPLEEETNVCSALSNTD